VPESTRELTKRFAFNHLDSLREVFDRHPGRVACVILEPAASESPAKGFLQGVKDLCQAQGAVLIFDEMITGFRWHARGAQALYGVTPDLSTFGKGLGNGFSVSALVGRRDIMERGGLDHKAERVFLLSTTHGGEIHALAAARATVTTVLQEPVIEHLWSIGEKLQRGLRAIAADLKIGHRLQVAGDACSPYFAFLDEQGAPSAPLRTLFLQETIRHGVLMPYLAPSYSHGEGDLAATLEACRNALEMVSRAIARGSTEGLLVGAPTKPVFRKYN
jgi:glutamate-1-semialdehyde 2,1-aminomutase